MDALLEYNIMIGWAGRLMKYEGILYSFVTAVYLTRNWKCVRDGMQYVDGLS